MGVGVWVWVMNEERELGIFEGGIWEMGEMEGLGGIMEGRMGIVRKIGGGDEEKLCWVEEKCMEKVELFKEWEVIV